MYSYSLLSIRELRSQAAITQSPKAQVSLEITSLNLTANQLMQHLKRTFDSSGGLQGLFVVPFVLSFRTGTLLGTTCEPQPMRKPTDFCDLMQTVIKSQLSQKKSIFGG